MHLHLSFPHTWSVFIIHEGSSSSLPSGHKALRPLFILDGYPSRYFLIAVMKHLSRSSLGEEGFILAHSFESTVHDGRWMHGGKQEHDITHAVFAARKQREMGAGAQLLPSLLVIFSSGPVPMQ